jgi:hypothetical protein
MSQEVDHADLKAKEIPMHRKLALATGLLAAMITVTPLAVSAATTASMTSSTEVDFSWLSMMAGATAIAIGATMVVGATAGSGGIAAQIAGAGAAGRIAAACGGMAAAVATTGIEHKLGRPSSQGLPPTGS